MNAASRRSVKPVSLESEWVAGVDGCRGGWFVILCALAPRESMPVHITSRLCTDFQAVLDLTEQPIAVAVDMPIGLLEHAVPGGRGCDREARALLGRPRSSSVFSPPTRPGLAALKYADAARFNGAGMSKESFNILPKIREIDGVLCAQDQQRVFEAHPEMVFARLAGAPLQANKKTAAGRRDRMRLLRRVYATSFRDPVRMRVAHGLRHVALDDVVDAYALAHVARCLRDGHARRVPETDPPRDARGLRMEIWY